MERGHGGEFVGCAGKIVNLLGIALVPGSSGMGGRFSMAPNEVGLLTVNFERRRPKASPKETWRHSWRFCEMMSIRA